MGLRLLDRRADQVAPLGPRAVVVLHVAEPEEILQHEPRVARALADAAIRDHRLVGRDALRAVQRLQLVGALERPIVVARLRPRDALRAGNVPTTLTGFGETGRREDLAGELLRTAHVDERRGPGL